MRSAVIVAPLVAALLSLGGVAFTANPDNEATDLTKKILILDDCDPSPAGGWGPGQCVRDRGRVSRAEFNAYLPSPFSLSVVGHPAWEFGPNYLKINAVNALRVVNAGGRGHTFTEVAEYGGGRIPVPALNQGLTMAPECATSTDIAPGGGVEVLEALSVGNHKFQCCIHPWMRAQVKVLP